MGAKTKISWTDSSWNFGRGCSRVVAEGAVTSGCGDGTGGGCYAERTAGRFGGEGLPYEGLVRITAKGPRWTGVVKIIGAHLLDPMRWRDPRRIFVASVSDPFHEQLTFEQIAGWIGIVALCPSHTFQSLTKRARRMRQFFAWLATEAMLNRMAPASYCVERARELVLTHAERDVALFDRFAARHRESPQRFAIAWPLKNLWLGTSTEHQLAADERIPQLYMCPAVVRFISAEPLIGPIDLLHHLDPTGACDCAPGESHCVGGCAKNAEWRGADTKEGDEVSIDPRLSWVIAGCESGPGARDCEPEWYRLLRERCEDYGVAFFLKQAVAWDHGKDSIVAMGIGFGPGSFNKGSGFGGPVIELPYLDEKQHQEFPEVP